MCRAKTARHPFILNLVQSGWEPPERNMTVRAQHRNAAITQQWPTSGRTKKRIEKFRKRAYLIEASIGPGWPHPARAFPRGCLGNGSVQDIPEKPRTQPCFSGTSGPARRGRWQGTVGVFLRCQWCGLSRARVEWGGWRGRDRLRPVWRLAEWLSAWIWSSKSLPWKCRQPSAVCCLRTVFSSIIDQNVFEMTEKKFSDFGQNVWNNILFLVKADQRLSVNADKLISRLESSVLRIKEKGNHTAGKKEWIEGSQMHRRRRCCWRLVTWRKAGVSKQL